MSDVILRQMALDCMRKQAEQDTRNKVISSFSFCLQISALTSYPDFPQRIYYEL